MGVAVVVHAFQREGDPWAGTVNSRAREDSAAFLDQDTVGGASSGADAVRVDSGGSNQGMHQEAVGAQRKAALQVQVQISLPSDCGRVVDPDAAARRSP